MNTNDLLAGILAELQVQNQNLGFGHPPRPRYIYANRQYPDCLWYFWDGGKKEHEPINYHAITGIIEKLEIESKEFRGKPDIKVNLHIKADRRYVIQSGYETLFGQGLLYLLASLPKSALKKPLTIAVEPGDTEQVLFCRIYNPSTGENAYFPFESRKVDWAAIVSKAQAKINADGPPEPEPEQPRTVNEAQIRRLFAIAREAGFVDGALKILIGDFGYVSTRDISNTDYDLICKAAEDPSTAKLYNAKHDPVFAEAQALGTW